MGAKLAVRKARELMKIAAKSQVPEQLIYTLMHQRSWQWSGDVGRWLRADAPPAVRTVANVVIRAHAEQLDQLIAAIAEPLKICGVDVWLDGPYYDGDGVHTLRMNVHQG